MCQLFTHLKPRAVIVSRRNPEKNLWISLSIIESVVCLKHYRKYIIVTRSELESKRALYITIKQPEVLYQELIELVNNLCTLHWQENIYWKDQLYLLFKWFRPSLNDFNSETVSFSLVRSKISSAIYYTTRNGFIMSKYFREMIEKYGICNAHKAGKNLALPIKVVQTV